ncbi:MAG: lysylphosphatidylglycerol synthase transmembrane domain-containing protein [Balneolales bacterium]
MKSAIQHNIGDISQYFSKKYLFISISLSVISLVVLVYFTYTPDFFQHVRLKRLPGLLIAFTVAALRVWFFAAKLRYLSEQKLSWAASFRVVFTWDFTSSITPSTIGGAPLATYAMTREKITLGQSSAIMIYGIMLDQLLLLFMIPGLLVAGMYFAIVPENVGRLGQGAMLLMYLMLLSYAVVLIYGVFRNPSILKKTVNFIFRLPLLNRYKEPIARETETLESTSHELRKKPFRFVLTAFSLSTLTWIARASLPTIVVLSFLPADEVLSLLRSMAMALASMFMPTPGGSGGVEGLFAIFQGPLIERKAFLGISVFMWRLISYYIPVGIGMMVLSWYLKNQVAEGAVPDRPDKIDRQEVTEVSEK